LLLVPVLLLLLLLLLVLVLVLVLLHVSYFQRRCIEWSVKRASMHEQSQFRKQSSFRFFRHF
jgi:hypothetical protein